MGRPRKEIDSDQFEKLCGLQCTLAEISGWFGCSEDTVERWCKRTYSAGFADAFKRYSQSGKISLRRYQFKIAEKNAAMAIFLGKQYLGQRDIIETGTPEAMQNATQSIIKAINGKASEVWKDENTGV